MDNPLISNETGVARVSKSLVSEEVYVLFRLGKRTFVSFRRRVFSYPGYPGFIGYQGVIPWFFLLLTLVSLVIKGLHLNGWDTEGKMSIYDNERDFIIALVNHLPSISVCPVGRPEEATRDKAQIRAWFRDKVPLLVLGIQLKDGR
jgi:hypothetical protein